MDKKYDYSYEKTANYCYPNSNVLINKLNIKDDIGLSNYEGRLVSMRAGQLDVNPIKGNLDFSHLKALHKQLFQDIYHWAGDIRTCNIAKTDLFCLAQYIDSYANDVFSKLKRNNYFLNMPYKETVQALVELFADINALHPFRERKWKNSKTIHSSVS